MTEIFQDKRKLLLIIFILSGCGTIAELALIGHYEEVWQLIPLVLISVTLLSFILTLNFNNSFNWKTFKALLIATGLSGFVGTYLHLQANIEFESEMHPTQAFITTFTESLSGALPALAPGSMIIFALTGYLYTLLIKNKD